MAPVDQTYKPTHPGLVIVKFEEGSYNSSLLAEKEFKQGSRIVTFEDVEFDTKKKYSSVQCGEDRHFEFHSDLVYANHSCEPSCELIVDDTDDMYFRAKMDLKKVDALSFFYPANEWEMDQSFECACGSKQCLGTIQGAKYLTLAQLKQRGHVSKHILDLKAKAKTN